MMEFLQQNVFLVILVLSSGGMLVWELLKGGGGNNLTAAEATLKINRENALVIDVREANEWSTGHIPDARHIALGQLEKRLHEIEKFKDRPIIACCASGVRSANACRQLRKAGFSQVFNLNGGVSSWGDANLPLTTK